MHKPRHISRNQRDQLFLRIATLEQRAVVAAYSRSVHASPSAFEVRMRRVAHRLRAFIAGCSGNDRLCRLRAVAEAYESDAVSYGETIEALRWLGLDMKAGDRIGNQEKRQAARLAKQGTVAA